MCHVPPILNGLCKGVQRKPSRRMPGADEDDEFRERRKKYSEVSTRLLETDLYKAMIRISLIAKRPLFKFFCWAERRRSDMFKRRREAPYGWLVDLWNLPTAIGNTGNTLS